MRNREWKPRFHWDLMFTESISFLRSNSRRFAALTGNNGRAIDCNSVPLCYTNNHLCSTFRNERFPNESTITRAIREFESSLFSNDSRFFFASSLFCLVFAFWICGFSFIALLSLCFLFLSSLFFTKEEISWSFYFILCSCFILKSGNHRWSLVIFEKIDLNRNV